MEEQLTLDSLVKYIKKNFSTNIISDTQPEKIEVVPVKIDVDTKQKIENHLLYKFFGKYVSELTMLDVISMHPDIRVNKDKNTRDETLMNISFCASIITSLSESFASLDKSNQCISITKFFGKMHCEIKKRTSLTKYATPLHTWDKKTLVSACMEYNLTKTLLAFVATYMNINVFVLNRQIELFCANKVFNPYKHTIFVCNDNEYYKSVGHSNGYIWNFNKMEAFKYFITTHSDKINIYQQDANSPRIPFKIDNENDVELVWDIIDTDMKKNLLSYGYDDKSLNNSVNKTDDNNEVKKSTKSKTKNVEKTHEPVSEFPDTTEQVMHDVFIKTPICDDMNEKTRQSDDESLSSSPDITKQKLFVEDELNKKRCPELKELAGQNDIKLTYKLDGKSKIKTKQELINDLMKILK